MNGRAGTPAGGARRSRGTNASVSVNCRRPDNPDSRPYALDRNRAGHRVDERRLVAQRQVLVVMGRPDGDARPSRLVKPYLLLSSDGVRAARMSAPNAGRSPVESMLL